MKPKGCSILFVNNRGEILLLLRDDNARIPFPGRWDIPGGNVEPDETVEQCILREMKEELGVDIADYQLFTTHEFPDRIEYTFWAAADFDIDDIILTEGQAIRWFTEAEARSTKLAFGFNSVIDEFFDKKPYRRNT